ncbi:MAG TPA: hypothetical protein PKZ32_17925, partial [Candidatus Melainabacteria bacterium]|nr:hypothetical protein [Candidatus Melainabacteria bacterium]
MLKDDSNDTEARDSSTIRDIKSQELSNKCTSNVAIIVGTKSIYDLQNIADKMEVWAPNLPEYKLAAEGIRETVTDTSITLFNAATSESPEQEFLSWLPTVDLHHGEYSSDTPWEVIYVYGASITS